MKRYGSYIVTEHSAIANRTAAAVGKAHYWLLRASSLVMIVACSKSETELHTCQSSQSTITPKTGSGIMQPLPNELILCLELIWIPLFSFLEFSCAIAVEPYWPARQTDEESPGRSRLGCLRKDMQRCNP